MQVQVLPVATATTLVCRYVVKYHGESFDIACVQMAHTDKIESDSDANEFIVINSHFIK